MMGNDNIKEILREKGYEYFNNKRTLFGLKNYLEEIFSLISCDKQKDELPTLQEFLNNSGDFNIHPSAPSCWSRLCDSSVCCVLMGTFAVYTSVCYSMNKVNEAKLENNRKSILASMLLGMSSFVVTGLSIWSISLDFQENFQLSDRNSKLMKAFMGFNTIFFGAASISYFGLAAYKGYVRYKIDSIVDDLILGDKIGDCKADIYQASTSTSVPLLGSEETPSSSFSDTEEVSICIQSQKHYNTITQ